MTQSPKDDRWMETLRKKAESVFAKSDSIRADAETLDLKGLLHELSVYHVELEMQNRELRETQELLELSQRKYYELFHLAPVGYVTLTADARISEANLATCNLLEADRESIQNKPFIVHVAPAAHKTFFDHLSQVRQNRGRGSVTVPVRLRSGRELIVHLETVAIFEKDSSFRHFLVTMTNITDMVRAHEQMAQMTEELKASERRLKIRNDVAGIFLTCSEEETLRALLRLVVQELNCRLAVIAVNDDGGFVATSVELNESGDESFQAPGVSLRCGDLCRRWWKNVRRRSKPIMVFPEGREDRQTSEANLLIAPIRFRKQFLGMLAVSDPDAFFSSGDLETVKTLTDYLAPLLHARMEKHKHEAERRRLEAAQRLLEKQLHEAQKMESLGRLAGGVAHDFNNKLQVILGRLDLLLDTITPRDPAYAHAMEIQKAGIQSAEIVHQLLTFARKQMFEPRRLNLNESIENILKMLRRLIGEDVEILWKPGSDLWPVCMDPAQVDQMVTNLCINARDAIQGVGHIVVETANVSLSSDVSNSPEGLVPGDYVTLTVTDTGCGMDTETLNKIFDPFFTTKEVGKGTGLGLSIVYSIVKENKGHIIVHSEKGQGSSFKIFLPRCLPERESKPDKRSAGLPRGKGETVMVVEDDPANLAITGAMLERLGYKVLGASHPAEALKLAATFKEPIQLLLTDLVMPYMDGKTLADKIRRLQPGTKILFMSGYVSENLANYDFGSPQEVLLKKPFSREELALKVSRMLGRSLSSR